MHEFGSFGAWLKRRRKELDLTQAALAQRAGCSAAAIRKIEANERKPSQQLAELLAKELGISDTEKKAFLQFARHILPETESLTTAPVTFQSSELPKPSVSSNNLPTFLTSLIDRSRDIATVLELIVGEEARWITLIGPPGIGKTRLSIHCGKQALPHFRDGVWFVDLSPIHNAAFVLPAISRTLSHLGLPQASSLEQLTINLKEKELLLVLDNFEQVEDAAGEVAALLKGCPKIKVMVSSRVPLTIYGEYKYYVPALAIPARDAAGAPEALMQFEAVQLFVARARQFQTGFTINRENAAALVEICTRMDGIPLALELAAALLRQMSLAELAEILGTENETNWLKHIGYPARDLPARQQNLENMIAWSYTLLTPEEQVFFRHLGIFTGQFDSEAAAVICGANGMDASHVRTELEYLTEHSLLQQSRLAGQSYWHMLETIHEFALLQLTPDERPDLESRYVNYHRSLLERIPVSSARINLELFFKISGANLHQALRWAISAGDTDVALSLGIRLSDIWEHVGYLRESTVLIQQLLSMPDQVNGNLRIEFLERAATLAWQQHHFDIALSLADEALELARSDQIGDTYPTLLNLKGRVLIEQGKYHEAYDALRECHELSLRKPQVFNPGISLVQLGEVHLALGHHLQAQSVISTALGYLKNKNDRFYAMGITDLAEVALAVKDYGEAQRQLQRGKDIASQHVRRLLCYLSTLAGFLTLKPGNKLAALQRAVEIYGAVEALKGFSGEVLVPFYVELNTYRLALTHQRLEKGIWETAWKAGQSWNREEILARAIEGIFS